METNDTSIVSAQPAADNAPTDIAAALEPPPGPPADDGDILPEIRVNLRVLPQLTRDAWDALTHVNARWPFLFAHGGRLVRLEREGDSVISQELTPQRLHYTLNRVAYWYTARNGNHTPALPPKYVVEDMLADPAPPLPSLERVTTVPVFGPSGGLVATPGYDADSRIFYAPPSQFNLPPVLSAPTPTDVRLARQLLVEELLGDFPFTSDAELAHAVSAALLPFVRSMVVGATPLHLIEKPSPGTGAGLLAEVLCYPALGRGPTVMTLGRNEDETRRTLTARLGETPSVILIDNVHTLASAALSAAVTTPDIWTDRIIGSSRVARLPIRCLWLATGNNPSLSTEIARRVVRIRLDAKVARPEERSDFRHPDLIGWVRQHHARLVWALLTLVQAWMAAGRPAGDVTLGSFESWARTIGGILTVAEIPGFLQNRADVYEQSDAEGRVWAQLFTLWWKKVQGNPAGVADIWPLVGGDDPIALPLGNGNDRSQKTRLGLLLRDRRGRQFGDYRLVAEGQKQGAQRWRLERVPTVTEVPNE